MIKLEETLIENPVIAAIRNDSDLNKAIFSNAEVVFVLYGNLMNVKDICEKLKAAKKIVFIHLDMIEGLRGDVFGIEYIKQYADPYGIITTKPTNIRHAKQFGLCTIQRIFIIDSLSLETGIKNIREVTPDAVEVMPGIASKIINIIQNKVKAPIIAGGLINNKKDVIEALSSGAVAISTSSSELWNM
ncbi:glycerol-3-phosphate responsive antiterminator [Clostridium sp. YIM B02515]|jgi:glycerol uptake operon antiterminator|uniref:Glycerol-3-phosphate responsive antiterminator n=1 Tax=Clostridium rhizosphaerae TaxID=2803861 RepID=A0ABS1TDG0_9CLOT|nr:glycerol-3-phosphate responsive antiterminator [Clostridium rhizosphaerae]MBL4937394.1 glycerol-3-phosphate responsive antiterminator [Clostridium rhizosphaerae]